jgi:tetratricopeptide (TPR) repeat protein
VGTVTANRHWKDDGAVYGQIVTWNPNHHAGYLGLGKFHERRGETDLALKQYEQSVLLANAAEKAGPLQLLATLLGQSGNSIRSLELFKELTKLKPESPAAWNGVGNNLWALGQLEEAADAYKKAHEVDPDDTIACYNLVLVLNQVGRTDDAKRYLECSRGAN